MRHAIGSNPFTVAVRVQAKRVADGQIVGIDGEIASVRAGCRARPPQQEPPNPPLVRHERDSEISTEHPGAVRCFDPPFDRDQRVALGKIREFCGMHIVINGRSRLSGNRHAPLLHPTKTYAAGMAHADDLSGLDAVAQAELVRTGRATPLELVDAAIDRIERVNPTLNAVIHARFEQARAEAQGILPNGPLRGVPIVVKDLDGSTTNDPRHLGNRRLKELGAIVDHDSELVARLRRAGCIVVGKTNTPEFGLVPTTEPLAYGPTRNPWDLDRSPGGSSGGSGAAVASGMVPLAHGGDGGGSIRIPASACGIFGLKPTRGRITLGPDDGEVWGGFVARGVLSRTVRDTAAALDVIAGPAVGDPYWAPEPEDAYSRSSLVAPARLRIGFRTTVGGGLAEVAPACVAAVEDAAFLCESLGHEVVEASPAALEDPALVGAFITVLSAWTTRECDHLAAVLGRDVTPEDVEPITWFYAELGRATTAAAYVDALCALQTWSREMATWWADDFDILLTPTMAEPPALLGEMVADPADPGPAIARTIPFAAFTAPFNVTGQPAMSVPLYAHDGLPIGTQFAAAAGREDLLLALATQLERERPWVHTTPPVFA